MIIERISFKHKQALEDLLLKKFETVYQEVSELPKKFISKASLESKINYMLTENVGFIAIDKEPVAFIFGIFLEDMFYHRKGVYTPEWGFYFNNQPKVMLELLRNTYNVMKESDHQDHSISFFEHNQTDIQFMFDNCYGSRCMDAHLLVKADKIYNSDLKFESISDQNMEAILPILKEHNAYMNAAPALLGFDYENEQHQLKNWMNDKNVVLFAVTLNNEIIGMTKLVKGLSGGCDCASNSETLGIETTHIFEKHQGQGFGSMVVEMIHQYASQQGYKFLAVDYETMNPSAHYFWPKWFTPTIRSLVRNIGC